MKKLPLQGRTLALLAVIIPLLVLLFMSVCDQGRSPRSL